MTRQRSRGVVAIFVFHFDRKFEKENFFFKSPAFFFRAELNSPGSKCTNIYIFFFFLFRHFSPGGLFLFRHLKKTKKNKKRLVSQSEWQLFPTCWYRKIRTRWPLYMAVNIITPHFFFWNFIFLTEPQRNITAAPPPLQQPLEGGGHPIQLSSSLRQARRNIHFRVFFWFFFLLGRCRWAHRFKMSRRARLSSFSQTDT